MLRVDENKISLDDFNYLTGKVGWGTRDTEIVEEALNNTLFSVSIYEIIKLLDMEE